MNAFFRELRAVLLALAIVLIVVLVGCRGGEDAAAGEDGVKTEASAGASGETEDGEAAESDEAEDEAEPRPTVDRSVQQVVTADGELRFPEAPQPATFSTAGRLLELAVEVDDEVYPGQVLARIDATGLEQSVSEARAGLFGARRAVAESERGTEIERARLQLEQSKNSRWGSQAIRDATCGREKPFFDQASCDQAEANINAAEQSVQLAQLAYQTLLDNRESDQNAARSRLRAAELGLSRAQTALSGANLTTPITATVTDVSTAPGVDVAPGVTIMTLVRTWPLRFVTSNLGERYVGSVRAGDLAKVTLTAYPDQQFDASVYRIDAQGQRDQSGAVVFTVYLDMAPVEDLSFYAGMTGRVEITVGGE